MYYIFIIYLFLNFFSQIVTWLVIAREIVVVICVFPSFFSCIGLSLIRTPRLVDLSIINGIHWNLTNPNPIISGDLGSVNPLKNKFINKHNKYCFPFTTRCCENEISLADRHCGIMYPNNCAFPENLCL